LGGHEHVPLTSIPTLASALLANEAGSMHHVHNFLASLAVKSSMAASLLSPFDQVPTWAATPQRRRRRRTNTADGEVGNHKTTLKSTKRKVADDGDDEAHPDTTATTPSSTTGQPRKHRRVQRDETQTSQNKAAATTAKGRRRRSATTSTATTTVSKRGSQATSIAFLLNDASTDCALDDSTFVFDYAASPSSSQASSPTPSPIEPAAPSQPSPPIRSALHTAPPGGFPFPCHFVLG
jgi:hypothetical protein